MPCDHNRQVLGQSAGDRRENRRRPLERQRRRSQETQKTKGRCCSLAEYFQRPCLSGSARRHTTQSTIGALHHSSGSFPHVAVHGQPMPKCAPLHILKTVSYTHLTLPTI